MSWDCPDCNTDNHEMRSKCRNCKRPRDDKSKEPKQLGEKRMAELERRIQAHDLAMQEERDRKMGYCVITDEMVPVDEDFVTRNPILLKDLIKRVDRILKPQPKSVSKPVSAEKLIEAIMDRMEQDQAFHKGVMIELAVLHGCVEKGE